MNKKTKKQEHSLYIQFNQFNVAINKVINTSKYSNNKKKKNMVVINSIKKKKNYGCLYLASSKCGKWQLKWRKTLRQLKISHFVDQWLLCQALILKLHLSMLN